MVSYRGAGKRQLGVRRQSKVAAALWIGPGAIRQSGVVAAALRSLLTSGLSLLIAGLHHHSAIAKTAGQGAV